MKIIAIILTVFIPTIIWGTEQVPDKLVYKTDTLYIDFYPLEEIMRTDSKISDKVYGYTEANELIVSSDCWRGHTATWAIENDSLFLVEIIRSSDNTKLELNQVFDKTRIKNNKVFANWYTAEVKTEISQYNYIENYSYIDPSYLKCEVKKGLIKLIEITENKNLATPPGKDNTTKKTLP